MGIKEMFVGSNPSFSLLNPPAHGPKSPLMCFFRLQCHMAGRSKTHATLFGFGIDSAIISIRYPLENHHFSLNQRSQWAIFKFANCYVVSIINHEYQPSLQPSLTIIITIINH
jgi:hypothetical protein